MKKWKIAVVVLAVCLLVTVAYAATAAAGSQNDPLVTLSYLDNQFKKEVQGMVNSAVSSQQAQMEQALDDVISQRAGNASFKVVTLSKGQTLTGRVGCEIMLRIGTANCVTTESPGLIDTTTGTVLNNGGVLVTNHLYMITIDTRGVTATSNSVKVLVRGPYTIS